jgi:cytochrome c oxidase subunit 2
VDESYLREAILNPPAAVPEGFLPIMPTFAGRLTEEELQALIAYLKSLGRTGEMTTSRRASLH